ncbi:exopolysaccharide Pel transporter PelG [Alloalcanivorax sp. C16-1]|uniref:exopolysaccharide Pel transporter PelG n=1 Tax=Alloalcanivorax sp. C16-1 TaxID=3390051 RepID=UPI003970FB5A
MAGIGFELRKLMRRDSLLGMLRAYAYAGVIGSGPWVLSILGILATGLLTISVVSPVGAVTQFQVTVTYIIAFSLMLTGTLQLAFTRFCADRLFEKRDDLILSNFGGVTLLVTMVSGVLSAIAALFLFPAQSVLFQVTLVAAFTVVSNIWIATIFLSGMKQYRAIVLLYSVGYALTVGAAFLLRGFDLEGLLMGFLIGQVALLGGMLVLITRAYPTRRSVSYELFRRGWFYPSLALVGLFFNVGVWADKLMFWFDSSTGSPVIGALRASLIYDIPVFLAYLSLIPGMAIFLVRMETDFVEYYGNFYSAVREGGSLSYIEDMRNRMAATIRVGVFQIIKIQAMAALLIMVVAPDIFEALGISSLYLPLLRVQLVAAGLQVVFLAIINVFCYLDQRWILVALTALFLALNIVFTGLSLALGPQFFGYGFLAALAVCVLLGLWLVQRSMDRLEYQTFMLR